MNSKYTNDLEVTEALINNILNTRFEDIEQEVVDNTKRRILDMIGNAIVKTRTYRVIDRSQRDMLLDEIAFSLGDCSDESCQLQVGRFLSADQIVVGSLGEAGSRFVISLKLLNVETGEVLHTAFKVYPSLNDLVDGCEQLSRALVYGQ